MHGWITRVAARRPRGRLRWYARGLAAGCVWFGFLAVRRTDRMAELTGAGSRTVRLLGVRDLVSAVTLVASADPRRAVAIRVACDTSDIVTFARRRPLFSAIAAAYAALGALAYWFGTKDPGARARRHRFRRRH